jgi:hypothetical protein
MPKIRRKWSTECMKSAVEDVLNKRSGFMKAAKAYNVPKCTLIDYVKKVKAGQKLDDLLDTPLGRHSVLTA